MKNTKTYADHIAEYRARYHRDYPWSVEYIDEYGVKNTEDWSTRTLTEELKAGIVQILTVTHYSQFPED